MSQKLSLKLNNMLDILCENLAKYQHFYQEYEPIQNFKSFEEFLNFATENTYKEAIRRKEIVSAYSKQLRVEKNENVKRFLLNEIDYWTKTFAGNIHQIAGNKSLARHVAKKTLWLSEFEPVFANQKEASRPFDSIGKINLFGSDENINEVANCLRYHYYILTSTGPVFETTNILDKAGSESIHILLSETKPDKPVYHQIWINDELMLRATFKTDKSLSEYILQSFDASRSLIYLIGYTEEIFKKIGKNRSQETLTQEYLAKKLEYGKTKNANYLEQYLLISTELLCKIIQELKSSKNLPTNVPVFDDIEKILPSNQTMNQNDILNMKTYLSFRDHFTHQTEYNFKPFATLSNTTNLLKDFKKNMVKYLSLILSIPFSKLDEKINSIQPQTHYDVHSLLLLMDMRKAYRDLCVTHARLSPDQPNVFLKLGFITKQENKELIKALKLRNDICHEKLNESLAKKAQDTFKIILPIIVKIANEAQQKFNVSLINHYHPSIIPTPKNFKDIQKEFPFLNIDNKNDPDSHILNETLSIKTTDKKLIQEMYTLAHLFQTMVIQNHPIQNNPYFEENELEPVLKEYQSYTDTNQNNFRKHIFKAFANAWLKTGKLPSLKNNHIHD